jgi:orotidine-5'-phosphate decarboxylase
MPVPGTDDAKARDGAALHAAVHEPFAPRGAERRADGRLAAGVLAARYDAAFAGPAGIVIALDTDTVDASLRVVEATADLPGVAGYKLGLTMVLRLGLAAATTQLRGATRLPIVYDHQKAGPDVPDMAVKFCATCREAGVDGLILFPTAGPRAVDGFVGESIRQRLLPIVGGDLPFEDYNAAGGGYVVDDALDRIFARALALGADHFVVPGHTSDKLRRHAAALAARIDRPTFLVPGIGPLGGTLPDAVKAAPGCRVFGVVGRAVYAAPDPREAAQRLAEQALDAAA